MARKKAALSTEKQSVSKKKTKPVAAKASRKKAATKATPKVTEEVAKKADADDVLGPEVTSENNESPSDQPTDEN